MKYIPSVTIVLWISIITGYIFAREVFIMPMVKFPALLLLSIFLPVSFWTLQVKKKKLYSLVFIIIFTISNAMLVYGLFSNYATLESSVQNTENRIDPDLVKLLVSGNSEKERRVVSRIIFQKHGVTLPFKTQDNLFSLYTPSQEDKDIFMDNNENNYLIYLNKKNIFNQIITTFFLLTLQIVIFFSLLIYLILYDTPPPQVFQLKEELLG